MAANNPFAPAGTYATPGKPSPAYARGAAHDPIRAAYAQDYAQVPMRPTRGALFAYGQPMRQRPMGYGYGMPRRAYRDPGTPSDPFSGSGGY